MADPGEGWLLEPLTSERAGTLTGDGAVLRALVDVEAALTGAWADTGLGPSAVGGLAFTADALDRAALAAATRAGGNPVIPLVAQLRARADAQLTGSGEWVHRGATSQDILDTALMLVARGALAEARRTLVEAADVVAGLADAHRATLMVGRTLTQHAAPLTFGAKAAGWLNGLVSSIESIDALTFPVQLAGAVGTGSAFADLTGALDAGPRLRRALADRLWLSDPGRSWQVERSPVVVVGSAAALVVGSLGRVAADVLVLARTEVGELSEGSGGGSSAMPQKQNPTTSVLLRSAAIQAPGLLATLVASLPAADERPAGEWHAEWRPLQQLLRLAVESAEAATILVGGLVVDADRMAANLAASGGLVWAEHAQSVLTRELGRTEAAALVTRAVARVVSGHPFDEVLAAELAAAGHETAVLPLSADTGLATASAIVDDSIERYEAITRKGTHR